jgi:20S proteasome alpha/beta subunit
MIAGDPRGIQPVTVCAAAITNGTVIGASDRMLTSGTGDIEFEPSISKLHKLQDNICIMIAGDITLQTEILYRVIASFPLLPGSALAVKEVAEAYYKAFQESRAKMVERAILNPLGLESASDIFLRGDLGMRLASDLLNYKAPFIEAIVTGYDTSGPHIYQVNNNGVTCQDWVAFASIGGGAAHANSQFMFAGHNRSRPIPETLMLVYSAKKRAEVAPGVGSDTDMFFIDPPGRYFEVGEHVLNKLEDCYQGIRKSADNARKDANGEINKFIAEIQTAVPAAEPDQSDSSPGDSTTYLPPPSGESE